MRSMTSAKMSATLITLNLCRSFSGFSGIVSVTITSERALLFILSYAGPERTGCVTAALTLLAPFSIIMSAAFVLAAVSSAFAQGNGIGGITEATNMVTSYFDPGTKLIYAIGAVVGLIGGIKVYNKFSSGDPDTSKTAASWFGACIFLIVAATILRSFFL